MFPSEALGHALSLPRVSGKRLNVDDELHGHHDEPLVDIQGNRPRRQQLGGGKVLKQYFSFLDHESATKLMFAGSLICGKVQKLN